MTQPQVGSYDDIPEDEVATRLEVPLLWSPGVTPNPPPDSSGRGAHRRARRVGAQPPGVAQVTPRRGTAAGRHRAPASAAGVPQAPSQGSGHDGLAHTLRVGAVSATIVLVLFVAGLLALATWLP